MHIYDKDLNFQVRRAGDSNLTRWVSVTVARCCDCVPGRLGARVGAASLRGRGGQIHPARQVTAGVARLVLSSSTLTLTRPSLLSRPLCLSLCLCLCLSLCLCLCLCLLLGRHLRPDEFPPGQDDRITVVSVGEGGAQNGRMAECLNAAAKENLPLLFVVIDNGRAINTFTPDVAANSDV